MRSRILRARLIAPSSREVETRVTLLESSTKRSAIVALATLVVAICAACSSATRSAPDVSLSVSPVTGARTAGETFVVSGLTPHEAATVSLRATDFQHVLWASLATFDASSTGRIDTANAVSIGGSYRGSVPMGLMSYLRPLTSLSQVHAFSWGSATKPRTFTVSVAIGGHPVASRTFTRTQLATDTTELRTTLAAQGFVGTYSRLTHAPAQPRPAVLTFGGSEGGDDGGFLANEFAAAGYPSLSIGYFKEPGLPSTLSRIPIEYFAKALEWLGRQPGVDPHKMYVVGSSRGSEAAQLVAIHYPELVHGVILGSPSNRANQSSGIDYGAAWTIGGKPVPTQPTFGATPQPTGPGVFRDEQIHGPLFMVCGGSDAVWPACDYAKAIASRLQARHSTYAHLLYEYPSAGHLVDEFAPLEPLWIPQSADSQYAGKTAISSSIVQYSIWQHVLAFIRSTS